jgi:GT2 family glycosyltransferase
MGALFDPSTVKLRHCTNISEFYSYSKMRYIPGTAFLLHREIFERTQGFDEELFTYWEDVDFSQRVQELQYPMLVDQNWVIRHGIGKTCHKNPLYTIYYYQRNRKKISYKYSHNLIEKSKLLAHLSRDWTKLSMRLVRAGRSPDLKLLSKAIID